MKRSRLPLLTLGCLLVSVQLQSAQAQGNLTPKANQLNVNVSQIVLPQNFKLKLQTIPNFGAAPIFKTLDAAASGRFLGGNTIWLTQQGIEANRVARVQNFSANVAKLQPLANQPRIQAVLSASRLEGLSEPILQVSTKSGPLDIRLMGADVGASIAASELGQDAGQNAQQVMTNVAQQLNIDTAYVQQVARAEPQQRLNVAMKLSPDIAKVINGRNIGQLLAPAGTGSGLDAVPANCPPANTGLFASYDFPMKKHLPAVKNQGARGTCWAFATVGVAETLIKMSYNRRVDLSEEDYVAYSKLRYGAPTDPDGADPFALLGLNAQNAYRFAFENVWEYNQSRSRVATETPANSGKFNYSNSCLNYPHQNQCEDTVSQAETGCIVADGKTVCGAQIPSDRTPYGINTSYLRNVWDWNQKDGGLGWAVFALGFGTPVMLLHDARYLQADARGFVGDLPYNVVNHPVKQANGSVNWVPNTANDVNWWNHIAMLVGYISNQQLQTVVPGAPAGAGGGYFIMKNSWGSCWADGGYIYLSWDWMKKYAGGLYLGERITNN